MRLRWASAVSLVASMVMLIAPWLAPNLAPSKPVVVIDDSRSVDAGALREVAGDIERLRLDDVRWASQPGVSQPRALGINREPSDRSNIASAVAVAMTRSDEVIVVSDGRFTDASLDLPGPPERLTMVLVPTIASPRIAGVATPWRLPAGSTGEAQVTVAAQPDGRPLRLSWSLGDASGSVPVVAGDAGPTVVPLTVPNEARGALPLAIQLTDGPSGEVVDVWRDTVQVAQPALVGLVGAPDLVAPLTSAGFQVMPLEAGTPFPSRPDVVVTGRSLAETEAALGDVASFVDRGGGLVLVGGEASFRAGGWQAERVAAALPVRLPPQPGSGEALVVVLDRSTSMAQGDRLGRSVTGIVRLLSRLEANDRFGVVSFATEFQTDVPFGLVTSSGRAQAEAALRGLEPNGATYIDPALNQALAWLEDTEAERREIVIVTDGELSEGRPQLTGAFDTEAFVLRAQAAGITLQAVAIGDRSDVEELEALVVPTGGSVTVATNGDAIADRVDEASDRQSEAWLIDPAGPVTTQAHPATPSGLQLPAGRWHQATAKPAASVLVGDAEARVGVAAANVGSGRSVAFTAADWSDLTDDIVRATWWTQNAREDVEVAVSSVGLNAVRVTVNGPTEGGDQPWFVRTGGTEQPLVETRPGRFEVVLDRVPGAPTTAVVVGGAGERRRVQLPGTRELDPAVEDGLAWVERHGGTTVTEWPDRSVLTLRSLNGDRPYQPFVWLSGVFFLMAVWLERRWLTRLP